jgi:hypothetical protein
MATNCFSDLWYVLVNFEVGITNLGVCVVMSVVFWMGGFNEGGYSWSASPEQQFHYHPTVRVVLKFLTYVFCS